MDRQGDREPRPPPAPPAGCRGATPVQLDQPTRDRQAEPETSVAPRAARIGLAEALEDVRQELGRDAFAGVLYHELDLVLPLGATHRDPSSRRGELDRIRQEVP